MDHLTNLNKERKVRRKGTPELGNAVIFGKLQPQARELEEAVLGAIMLEKNAVDIAFEHLKPNVFMWMHIRRYFQLCRRSNKKLPDRYLTVVEELKARGN